MEESNLKHFLMKQQARYNGKVGLYPTNNIEQFKLNWSSSWGPTPNRWYSAEDKDFRTDFGSGKKDLISYIPPSYFTYSTTKNNMSVISNTGVNIVSDFYTDYTNTDIGFNTTRFVVVKPWSYWNDGGNALNFIEETSYSWAPGAGAASTIYIPKTGYIFGATVYTVDANTTQNCTIVGGTYSAGEWCVVVHKGKSSLAQTSTGTINGRTMGATTSIPSTIIPTASDNNGVGIHMFTNGGVDGAIAEVIIYNSILSAGNTTLVENYLKSKWAITY